MDDNKRDLNKIKRTKSDLIKTTITTYLQKRNYSTIGKCENLTRNEQIQYFLVENELNKTNSILYSCYNNDPLIIDHNFIKFLTWLKDLIKNKNIGHDLEYLIAPLFLHLYLEILKTGQNERALLFFKQHLPSIDKTKCDDFLKDLINLFTNDLDATCLKEQYRSNKYLIELTTTSIRLLKRFVNDNCHVVFLHILHNWFDIREINDDQTMINNIDDNGENTSNDQICNGTHGDKFNKLLKIIQDLDNEPKQVFVVKITNNKIPINCGILQRSCGIIVYNQNNIVNLRSIHSYDPIFDNNDSKEIQLINHSQQIYDIKISTNYQYLVSGSSDNTLNIYNLLNNYELIGVCTGHLGPIYCLTISSNNLYVASGSNDTTARLWNISNGQNLRIFVGHSQSILTIDFHPNCLYLATGSSDHNIRLWCLNNGQSLRLFYGCKSMIYSIRFNPSGDQLISISDDKRIRIWDVLKSKILSEFKIKTEQPITKLLFHQNGKLLCCASTDGILRIYDLDNCKSDNSNNNNNNNNNNSDNYEFEPQIINVNGKILDLECCFDTFACLTT